MEKREKPAKQAPESLGYIASDYDIWAMSRAMWLKFSGASFAIFSFLHFGPNFFVLAPFSLPKEPLDL